MKRNTIWLLEAFKVEPNLTQPLNKERIDVFIGHAEREISARFIQRNTTGDPTFFLEPVQHLEIFHRL